MPRGVMDIAVRDSGSDSDDSEMEMEEFQALVSKHGRKVKVQHINNVEAIMEKIQTLAQATCDDGDPGMCCTVADDREEPVDAHDDFKREAAFVEQAKAAVAIVIPRLKAAGIPVVRPPDYFAEMVKSDEHMKKIKAKLLSEQQTLDQSEKARRQRELKKFGKKIQHEVIEKRRKEKRDALDAIKQMKTKSMSRTSRDEKFGFGPKSRGRGGKGGKGAPAGKSGGKKGGKPQKQKRPGLSKRRAGKK